MTLPVLNAAELVVFLVTGNDKAQILEKVLSADKSLPALPAQLIHPVHGELLWLSSLVPGSVAGRGAVSTEFE
jgi:6-phosphogluconolactonase